MTPFLKQVANHYHPAPEISRMCFIFPNKRAISFFRKYLAEECARNASVMIAPETITINDFFSRLSEMRTADRLTSLLTLYDCYKELNPAAEPLDEFMFWGGIILNDFAARRTAPDASLAAACSLPNACSLLESLLAASPQSRTARLLYR